MHKRSWPALIIVALVLNLLAPMAFAQLSPSLSLSFDKSEYHPGDFAILTVVMNNVPANLGGVTAEIEFDPNVFHQPTLEDLDLTNSLLVGSGSLAVTDFAVPGQIQVSIVNPNGPNAAVIDTTTAIGKVFSLTLLVKDTAPNNMYADVTFANLSGRTGGDGVQIIDTDEVVLDVNFSHNYTYAYIWRGGTLSGSVSLVGRTDHSGVPVRIYERVYDVYNYTYNEFLRGSSTTDSGGRYTITNVSPGTYQVEIGWGDFDPARPPYLSKRITDVYIGSSYNVPIDVELLPGNVKDTDSSMDTVFLEDLSAMAKAWTAGTDTGTWNARADLNRDGTVYLSDLDLLAGHWAMAGAKSGDPSAGHLFSYLAPAPTPSSITLVAPPTIYGQWTELQATLSPPLAGKEIEFFIGEQGQVCTAGVGECSASYLAITDASGTATLPLFTTWPAGKLPVTAVFFGDYQNVGSEATVPWTITHSNAVLAYAGGVEVTTNGTTELGATLMANYSGVSKPIHDANVIFTVRKVAGGTVGSFPADFYMDGSYLASPSLPNEPLYVDVALAPSNKYTADPVTVMLKATPVVLMPEFGVAGVYSDPANLTATLSSAIEGKAITFKVQGLPVGTAWTDASGTATLAYPVDELPGYYPLTAHFTGDDYWLNSVGETTLYITAETATLTYTGATVSGGTDLFTLSAAVTQEADGTLGDITKAGAVVFEIYNNGTLFAQYEAHVDYYGTATITIASLAAANFDVYMSLVSTYGGQPIAYTGTGAGTISPPPVVATAISTAGMTASQVVEGGVTYLAGTAFATLDQSQAGLTVTFAVDGTTVCSGTTDTEGYASCTIHVEVPNYTASDFTATVSGWVDYVYSNPITFY